MPLNDIDDPNRHIYGPCERCTSKHGMQVYIIGSFPARLCNKCRRKLQHELLYQPEFKALRACEAAKQKALFYNDHEQYNELNKLDDDLRRGAAPFLHRFMGERYTPKFMPKKSGGKKDG